MHRCQKAISCFCSAPPTARTLATAATALKPRISPGSESSQGDHFRSSKDQRQGPGPQTKRPLPQGAQQQRLPAQSAPSVPTRKNWGLPSSSTSTPQPPPLAQSPPPAQSRLSFSQRPPSDKLVFQRRSSEPKPEPSTRTQPPSRPDNQAAPIPTVQFDRSSLRRPKTKPQTEWTPNQERRAAPTKASPAHRAGQRAFRPLKVKPEVYVPTTISVSNLAHLLDVKLERLQQRMNRVGMKSQSNYDYILTSDYAVLLAEEFGFNPIVDDEAAFDILPPMPHPNPSTLPSRPPVVTIMGHVDHGKTTLLDTLRSASVAKGEAGGITQHIGAFSVPVSVKDTKQTITFLDTPGHAAFSAMRARGANVTDIIVLVVAADDGIMPQTKEVINLVKASNCEGNLLVAINKVDKPGADTDKVKKALLAEGLQLEEFGGDVPSVDVSGLTGHGLPELLETLSAMSEMMDLRAEREGQAYGHILESHVQKGLGPVATVLISRGALEAGSHVISGQTSAKARRMTDSTGKVVKVAYPGMAVMLSGWKSLPKAGDTVLEGPESDIKKALANRERKAALLGMQEDAEAINAARKQERDSRAAEEEGAAVIQAPTGPKELRLVIKADVSGSAEAVEGAITGIGNHIAVSKVITTGVGDVTESDVMLAKAAGATIVCFSVSVPRAVQNIANQNGVPITSSNIIYKLIDDIRDRIISMLPVIVEKKVTGEATVLQLFDIQLKSKVTKTIAGCRVINGLLDKSKCVRIVRNGETIYDGNLDTMKQLKKDITEARKGNECGLGFENFLDVKVGDLIQVYDRIEKTGVL